MTNNEDPVSKLVKRVLIYRLGSLGDTVVALPSLHLVARAFPDAERCMLTNLPVNQKAPAAAAVLAGTGLVHGYIEYPVGLRSPWQILTLWWKLLRWRPEVLVYLAAARGIRAARRDRVFFRLCGIVRQVGAPFDESLQTNLLQPDGRTYEREAARLARTLLVLGDAHPDDPASWSLHLSVAEHRRAEQVLAPAQGRPTLAVSLGTKRQSGDWGPVAWHALLTRLGAELHEFALVLAGVADEHVASEAAADGWRAGNAGPVINLCGLLTPRETAAVFARARVFVGHDSGPMHLAAAVQTPCVAIFSARQKPGMWFPLGDRHRVLYHRVECWGCGLDTCVVERKRCVTSIRVEEVEREVLEALR